jgi:hypothetical protein
MPKPKIVVKLQERRAKVRSPRLLGAASIKLRSTIHQMCWRANILSCRHEVFSALLVLAPQPPQAAAAKLVEQAEAEQRRTLRACNHGLWATPSSSPLNAGSAPASTALAADNASNSALGDINPLRAQELAGMLAQARARVITGAHHAGQQPTAAKYPPILQRPCGVVGDAARFGPGREGDCPPPALPLPLQAPGVLVVQQPGSGLGALVTAALRGCRRQQPQLPTSASHAVHPSQLQAAIGLAADDPGAVKVETYTLVAFGGTTAVPVAPQGPADGARSTAGGNSDDSAARLEQHGSESHLGPREAGRSQPPRCHGHGQGSGSGTPPPDCGPALPRVTPMPGCDARSSRGAPEQEQEQLPPEQEQCGTGSGREIRSWRDVVACARRHSGWVVVVEVVDTLDHLGGSCSGGPQRRASKSRGQVSAGPAAGADGAKVAADAGDDGDDDSDGGGSDAGVERVVAGCQRALLAAALLSGAPALIVLGEGSGSPGIVLGEGSGSPGISASGGPQQLPAQRVPAASRPQPAGKPGKGTGQGGPVPLTYPLWPVFTSGAHLAPYLQVAVVGACA